MNSHKDLLVWQKSMQLVTIVYEITVQLPAEERFGLVSQMRRCAVSIPSNIAEGYARQNRKENKQFVNIAYGSAVELDTQIIICTKLGFFEEKTLLQLAGLLEEIRKMLYRYRQSLE
ncbi:MAG: four helix bundle protein [Patescibacteria group bacterium]|nr:four helix bundle protein [Patescibacteria group bacterium]